MLVLFYSHTIPVIFILSRSTVCARLVLISHGVNGAWAFKPILIPFLSSQIGYCLGRSFHPSSPLGFYLCCSFSCHTHRPTGFHSYHVSPWDSIRFITSFLGLPQPIHFTSTSYCTHGPIGYHSCHIGPLGLLPLFLGFLVPFALPLPLITPMALLAIILVALAHWVYLSYFFYHLYFFFLSFSSL